MDIHELVSAIDAMSAMEVTIQLLVKAGLKEKDAELLIAALLDETNDLPKENGC